MDRCPKDSPHAGIFINFLGIRIQPTPDDEGSSGFLQNPAKNLENDVFAAFAVVVEFDANNVADGTILVDFWHLGLGDLSTSRYSWV